MQMVRKLSIVFGTCCVLVLTGCASAPRAAWEHAAKQTQNKAQEERLMVKTASSSVVVAKIEDAIQGVNNLMQQEKGFVANSNSTGETEAFLELRVPADKLVWVLDQLAALGQEKRRQISTEDVTDQVQDQAGILKNKVALRDRLRDLLEKAKTVQDVIAVEEQLTRLQTEIETLEGRLKNTKQNIEYAVVHLRLSRTIIYGPLGYIGYGLWWVIEKMFVIQ